MEDKLTAITELIRSLLGDAYEAGQKAVVAEVITANSLIAQAREESRLLRVELDSIKKVWWQTIRNELTKPEYASFVEAKDAKGLFDYLSDKNISQQMDPVPVGDVRAAISAVFTQLRFSNFGEEDAEIKELWRGLLREQLDTIGPAPTVPFSQVKPLAEKAVEYRLIEPGTVIGRKLVSRLDLLDLEGRVKSELDIIESMGWANGADQGNSPNPNTPIGV